MERVVIKRRGGILPAELELWIGEQRIEGVVGYSIEEHYRSIPKVTFTVECEELIEEVEFEECELKIQGVKTNGSQ